MLLEIDVEEEVYGEGVKVEEGCEEVLVFLRGEKVSDILSGKGEGESIDLSFYEYCFVVVEELEGC